LIFVAPVVFVLREKERLRVYTTASTNRTKGADIARFVLDYPGRKPFVGHRVERIAQVSQESLATLPSNARLNGAAPTIVDVAIVGVSVSAHSPFSRSICASLRIASLKPALSLLYSGTS
jgi:hypothetical protein